MKRRYIKGLARETRYISVSMGKALIYYIIKPLSLIHHQFVPPAAKNLWNNYHWSFVIAH